MKIETLKSTGYTKREDTLRILVCAENRQQVNDVLAGKEVLTVYTDNTGEDIFVEDLKGYLYPDSLTEISEGCFELVLTNKAPTSQSVREKVIAKIEAYDKSEAVNSFTLGDKRMWLDKETRVGLVNSISIEKAAGKETTTLWFDAVQYIIPVDTALQMLAALELYALDCYNVTQSHIASVRLLDNVETLETYDYTAGYPERLVFNLNT